MYKRFELSSPKKFQQKNFRKSLELLVNISVIIDELYLKINLKAVPSTDMGREKFE
jgi:hypothetical protein